jgi:hypothetical protein
VIGDDGEPNAKAIETAVKAVVTDYPEFRATVGGSGGSNFESGNPQKKIDIANMDAKEFKKLQDRIMRGEKIQL